MRELLCIFCIVQIWAAGEVCQNCSMPARRGSANSPGPYLEDRGHCGCGRHCLPPLQQAMGPAHGADRRLSFSHAETEGHVSSGLKFSAIGTSQWHASGYWMGRLDGLQRGAW